jgi:NDP-sugar pyrophosphorylase family protein
MFSERTVAAIVLAGGKGTRFQSVAGTSQKVLWPVAGTPLIQYTTHLLDSKVVRHVVFNVGYRAKDVERWVSNQRFPFRQVSVSVQQQWTFFDAVTRAVALTSEGTVVICNADEIRVGLSLNDALAFHCRHGALVTLVGVRKRRLSRYRLLHVNEEHLLTASEYCPKRFALDEETEGLVNGGVAILNRDAVSHFDGDGGGSGWEAMLTPLTSRGQIRVFAATGVDYYNVGTWEELLDAETFLASGVGEYPGQR